MILYSSLTCNLRFKLTPGEFFQNLSKFIKIHQNLSKFIKIYQNLSKFIKIYQNYTIVNNVKQ